MRTLLLLSMTLFFNGCMMGSFTLPDFHADIPAENLKAYKASESVICEEQMSFAPFVWFKVDNVHKVGDQFEAESFAMGPVYLFSHAKETCYDKDGKQLFYSSWGSYLWDILGSYYVRQYWEQGEWVEEKHTGYLLGLFARSSTRKGTCYSVLFIPIATDS